MTPAARLFYETNSLQSKSSSLRKFDKKRVRHYISCHRSARHGLIREQKVCGVHALATNLARTEHGWATESTGDGSVAWALPNISNLEERHVWLHNEAVCKNIQG